MSKEILIVDDNSDIRNILNDLIIDAGYKTRIAANYNQALSEIDKKMPDVAILDVKLDKGDNDGIELLSHIKSKNKDVPVIIITGHAHVEMAVNSLKHARVWGSPQPEVHRAIQSKALLQKHFGLPWSHGVDDKELGRQRGEDAHDLEFGRLGQPFLWDSPNNTCQPRQHVVVQSVPYEHGPLCLHGFTCRLSFH